MTIQLPSLSLGKSSFVNQFVNKNFVPEHEITESTETYISRRTIEGNKRVICDDGHVQEPTVQSNWKIAAV